ncbi:hypothetical protein MWN34_10850 [Ancylobacter sp. 6x-1]|uniref:Uncharacterized protein n=1 Tax=Ancylobacter crimeensis TaxID=2579147 RepID=A0ABT0DBS3_9HYPH|nr:hypothetical protein [Ancylobacter crimeensis]MCK0197411.1 hypothetical protein [Ancylobacter crimeensis]
MTEPTHQILTLDELRGRLARSKASGINPRTVDDIFAEAEAIFRECHPAATSHPTEISGKLPPPVAD